MKNASLAGAPPPPAYQLDPARIIETAEKLARRIGASLPGSVLAGLALELVRIARDTDRQVRQARRPILVIRNTSVTAIGCGLLGIWFLLNRIHFRWEFGSTFTELFEVTGAAVNFLVMLSGALWFLYVRRWCFEREQTTAFRPHRSALLFSDSRVGRQLGRTSHARRGG